jgi:cystine transport system ATP-binding protein
LSIKLKNIQKSFNNQQVLSDINLTINDHETTVILGPSGSGKSTLLRTIHLLEIPDMGEFEINQQKIDFGHKITKKEITNFRRMTGMVFQNFNLFPHLTALENVTEGLIYVLKQPKEAANSQAKLLLTKVGLADKENVYPSRLSGGMQQRVAIARALAMQPDFILLDEPTSALDPELEAEVLKVIGDLTQEKKSLLIVTHNLAFAKEIADRIIFLENGVISFDGSPDLFFNGNFKRIQAFISAMQFN